MSAPGRVVLLNGTPSSGKTTLVRALREVLEPPHWSLSLDDFRKGYLARNWDPFRGPWWSGHERSLFLLVLHGYLRSLRAMAETGHHVLAEAVILPATARLYDDTFSGLVLYLVGVRCPIDVAEERERQRTDRVTPGGIPLRVPEFDLVHTGRRYDVEVDTSKQQVDECVSAILGALGRDARGRIALPG